MEDAAMSRSHWLLALVGGLSVLCLSVRAQELNKATQNAAGPKSYPVLPPTDDSGLGYELLPSVKPKYMNIWLKDTGFWRLGGNTGTVPGTNFLGTTDGQPLVVKTNGVEAMRIDSAGRVGIGTASPTQTLDVSGTAQFTGLRLPTGAVAGRVLISDALGNGTWQPAGSGTGWILTGNAGTTPGNHFLGTTDDRALEVRVNNIRALRIEPQSYSPNMIGGGALNYVVGGVHGAVIGGGGNVVPNRVTDHYGTVGGGYDNLAGDDNTLTEKYAATVAGGYGNRAGGSHSAVGGGFFNAASGEKGTVPGGELNTAAGDYSFASGRRAKANNIGVFAWADGTDADFPVSVDHRFGARATGGVYFYTNTSLTSGSYLAAGSGTWTNVSDRNAKTDFAHWDSRDVLRKVAAMPLTSWRYKGEDESIRHFGPMAQDFHAAFGLGDSDKGITTIDADGIAFAAIQGLSDVVKEKDAEIAELRKRLIALEGTVSRMQK
jgi:hypothetical protein